MRDERGLRAQKERHQCFRDHSLLIAASDGEVHCEAIQGLYFANTRLLSRLELRSNGEPLMPVQAAAGRTAPRTTASANARAGSASCASRLTRTCGTRCGARL
jgi:hypothetical protein